MKRISLVLFLLLGLVFANDVKKIISHDDRIDDRFLQQVESEYLNTFILSDRTIGLIATIGGKSYYVKRIEDAGNFQLRLIDVDSGRQVSSLPYFRMDSFTIDSTGNYYLIELGSGEILKIPMWMDIESITQLLLNYSGIPIYYNGKIIGVTLFLAQNIQLSLFSPFYGLYDIQIKNPYEKIFKDMKLELYFDEKTIRFIVETEEEKEKKKNKK